MIRQFLWSRLRGLIADLFHRVYYNSLVFSRTYWLGTRTLKCPFDLWIYQEIIHELRPDVIIESGTHHGGSALFLASMCDLVDHGKVVTIDVEEQADRPQHERIHYLLGSSVAASTVDSVRRLIGDGDRVMVILDSDHRKEHVLDELRLYSELVSIDSYLIVEDTNLGHLVLPDYGPGPMEAVSEFLEACDAFVVDRTREKFILTFNPGGYLKRVK